MMFKINDHETSTPKIINEANSVNITRIENVMNML